MPPSSVIVDRTCLEEGNRGTWRKILEAQKRYQLRKLYYVKHTPGEAYRFLIGGRQNALSAYATRASLFLSTRGTSVDIGAWKVGGFIKPGDLGSPIVKASVIHDSIHTLQNHVENLRFSSNTPGLG